MAKLPKAEQAAAVRRHQRFVAAGYVRDRFPDVEKITIGQTWHDPDFLGGGEPSTDSHTRSPDNSASFEIACGNRECVGGGIDLGEEIEDMISNRETSRSGKRQCRGSADPERVGKHWCLMELEYTVEVSYQERSATPD